MAESYPIGVRNTLLQAEHYQAIGPAIWVYMWLVDRVTEEYVAPGGELRGRVLGGAVIKAESIAETFGIHQQTVRNHLRHLNWSRYITMSRHRDGFIVEVRNSQKWTRLTTQGSGGADPLQTSRVSDMTNSRLRQTANSRVSQDAKTLSLELTHSRVPSTKTLQWDQDNAEDMGSIDVDDDAATGQPDDQPKGDQDRTECLSLINRSRPDWPLSGDRYREFLAYEDRLPWSVIRKAVDRTLAAGARDLKYCTSILERYVECGVRTVADVDALDAEFQAEKRRRSQSTPDKRPGKRPRSNVILQRDKPKTDADYAFLYGRFQPGPDQSGSEGPPKAGQHHEARAGPGGDDHAAALDRARTRLPNDAHALRL